MIMKALPKGEPSIPEYGKQKRLYGYLSAFFMSFYSVDIYVDVRHRWRGFAALYLLLMLCIISIPNAIETHNKVSKYVNGVIKPAIDKFPSIEIVDGEVIFPQKKPFIIRNPQTNDALIIIDTTGKVIDVPSKEYPHLVLLISKYSMTTKFGAAPASTDVFQRGISEKLTHEELEKTFQILKKLYLYAFYPCMVAFWFGMIFSGLCFFSFIYKMFSIILLHYKLTFAQALRLTIVTFTAPAVLANIFVLFNMKNFVVAASVMGIWFGYFLFAIRSNKYAAKYPLVI